MTATSLPKTRRVPRLVWALLGAALAVAYGMLVDNMRFGPPLVMLGLGGLAVVLCAMSAWHVVSPLVSADEAASAEIQSQPGRLKELEREKQFVLKAIKEIELDFQMRKISEQDHRELTERYRGRALRVLGEIDTGGDYRSLIERELRERLAHPASAETTESSATGASKSARREVVGRVRENDEGFRSPCSSCKAMNEGDAQFCKKCGAKLSA